MLFGGTWRSMLPDHEIDDAKQDKRRAVSSRWCLWSKKKRMQGSSCQ